MSSSKSSAAVTSYKSSTSSFATSESFSSAAKSSTAFTATKSSTAFTATKSSAFAASANGCGGTVARCGRYGGSAVTRGGRGSVGVRRVVRPDWEVAHWLWFW